MKSRKSSGRLILLVLLACFSVKTSDALLVKQNPNVVSMTPPRRNVLRSKPIRIGSENRHIFSHRFPPRGGGQKLDMVTDSFNGAPFQQSSLILLGTNALGFIISLATGSHLHLDLLGTGAFAAAALPTLLSSTCTRIRLSSAAVFTWGAKLASFLFFRALKVKHDARLGDTLSTVGGTFGFWFVSLIWGIVGSLPHTLGTTTTNPGSPISLTIGGTVYILGLLTESMADYQKWTFKSSNPGKFCNVGLWSVSQHPNFFGNLLIWTGILIMNSDSLLEIQSGGNDGSTFLANLWGSRRLALAFLSPLFLWTLFSGQANGSITNAVEMATKRYGKDPAFNEYVETVPKIVPNIFRWLKQLAKGLLPV